MTAFLESPKISNKEFICIQNLQGLVTDGGGAINCFLAFAQLLLSNASETVLSQSADIFAIFYTNS